MYDSFPEGGLGADGDTLVALLSQAVSSDPEMSALISHDVLAISQGLDTAGYYSFDVWLTLKRAVDLIPHDLIIERMCS